MDDTQRQEAFTSALGTEHVVLQTGANATVVPAVFLLGLFTQVRLVDAAMEYNHFLTGMARIRRYYRTLTPEAADYFAAERGHWPETQVTPGLRLGTFIAFITTVASMVAVINSIAAGAGVALVADDRLGDAQRGQALGLGVAVAVAIMAAFLTYQRSRLSLSLSADAVATQVDRPQPDRRGR